MPFYVLLYTLFITFIILYITQYTKSYTTYYTINYIYTESCPTRWNKMLERDKTTSNNKPSILSKILVNEMKSASDMATLYNIPTILCDQNITITNIRIKDSFQTCINNIITPFTGGWYNIYNTLIYGISQSFPQAKQGDSYLGMPDFLAPNLVLATPISLFRYILALSLKFPVIGIVVLLSIYYPIILLLVGVGVGVGVDVVQQGSGGGGGLIDYSSDFTLTDRILDIGRCMCIVYSVCSIYGVCSIIHIQSLI